MNEKAIRNLLTSDARVRELISERAFELYKARSEDEDADGIGAVGEGKSEEDWFKAEEEIVNELTNKLIEAQAESWLIAETEEPAVQVARSFSSLVGFMLAKGGLPTRTDLLDARYYIIGLSYITGIFQIGQSLDEALFLHKFSNANAIVQALLYRVRTNSESPYFTKELKEELRPSLSNDEELKSYLEYAEREARLLFDLYKKLLLGQRVATA